MLVPRICMRASFENDRAHVDCGVKKIILASQSPWRKDILSKTGIPFSVEESGYEEDMSLKIPPRELAKRLALGKAEMVATRRPDALVIAADTFVVFGRHIIGKPHTPKRAREVLTMLSGKWHTIITGFAVIDGGSGKRVVRSVETRVHLRKADAKEIAAYVKTGEPLKVAGGYAIQGRAGALIDKIEGDYWNIVGLPLSAIVLELKKFGIRIGSGS